MDFQELEGVESLRFSWNAWPTTRLEAARCAVPFGVVCHPIQRLQDLPQLPYGPLECSSCRAALSNFCHVDYTAATWQCCICLHLNWFPSSRTGISETNLPAELFPTHNVVEYTLPSEGAAPLPPSVVFVIDCCGSEEDLRHTTQAVGEAIAGLPEWTRVGLVSFGGMVVVHRVGAPQPLAASILLQGESAAADKRLDKLLHHMASLLAQEGRAAAPAGEGAPGAPSKPASDWEPHHLLAQLANCRDSLTATLQSLRPDPSSASDLLRPKRVTGRALVAALALLGCGVPRGSPGRVVCLLSGPCTSGPGKVVEREYEQHLRSHHDILSDRTTHFRSAESFYLELARLAGERAVVLDVFGCCPDEVGLAEMRAAVETTGGTLLLANSPSSPSFRASLERLLRCNDQAALDMCFDGTLEVRASRGTRVAGAIGQCSALYQALPGKQGGGSSSASVGAHDWVSRASRVGRGGTWAWRLPGLTPDSTIALVFEISPRAPGEVAPDSTLIIQVSTSYLSCEGERRVRVITVGRRWKELRDAHGVRPPLGPAVDEMEAGIEAAEDAASTLFDVVTGFDQEAAAALVAKIAVAKLEVQGPDDVLRWLDLLLVRFGSKFGKYTPNAPHSFLLASNLSFLPIFVYHLSRSSILQTFNSSPDESAFRRAALIRESIANCLLMVQASVVAYSLSSPPERLPLERLVLRPDQVLLYDSFFELVVHHGATVAQWRRALFHEDESHGNFRKLLEEPGEAAREIAESRWLQPRLIVCDQNDSMSRFLTSRLSAFDLSGISGDRQGGAETPLPEDGSFQSFLRRFHNLVVQT